jgi:hypothetical protein
LAFPPSVVAAASVMLALKTTFPLELAWPPHLEAFSGYRAADLEACATSMYDEPHNSITTS